MNLVDQWNDHIIKGNQLSRELENIEELLEKAREADICFSSGSNGAIFIRVLSPEKMQELKESAIVAIIHTRDEKTAELEKLMGIRKPATVNPEFEAAIQEMENSQKTSTYVDNSGQDQIEEAPKEEPPAYPALDDTAVEDVRRMYQSEGKTLKEVAAIYGVTKSQMNTFISRHNLRRTSYEKDSVFLDAKVPAQFGKEGL